MPGGTAGLYVDFAALTFHAPIDDCPSTVYYGSDEQLVAVPLKGTTRLDVGAAVPLFKARLLNGPTNAAGSRHQYDVARDGQRFLLNVQLEDADASSITVVLNWQSGLSARERR